ncbi:hypothetical protein F4781DRAFT_400724 [Annulohypoxylon bovei var. microspora]|nr:hypothetical protein F4781DRAFT_400724 [Annulohypoxylon bovei var. microspora]
MADEIELRQKDSRGKELVNQDVFDIFNDYLQLKSSVSAAQAAIAISQLLPELRGDEVTLDDVFFFKLWRSTIAIAEQIPYDHPAQDRLVRVMRELTLLPDTGITIWEFRLWADLPVIGAVFRGYLNGPRHSNIKEEQAQIDEAWIRFHAFSAKLIGAGVVHFENQPIWMLREALEEDRHLPRTSALDRDLITAAMYIEFAGPVLVEALAANPDPVLSDVLRRSYKGGSLFKGEPGLTLERWLFWANRFTEEAEYTKTKEAKEIALHAARLMVVWSEKRLKK